MTAMKKYSSKDDDGSKKKLHAELRPNKSETHPAKKIPKTNSNDKE